MQVQELSYEELEKIAGGWVIPGPYSSDAVTVPKVFQANRVKAMSVVAEQ